MEPDVIIELEKLKELANSGRIPERIYWAASAAARDWANGPRENNMPSYEEARLAFNILKDDPERWAEWKEWRYCGGTGGQGSNWVSTDLFQAAHRHERYAGVGQARRSCFVTPGEAGRRLADKYLRDDAGEYDGMTRTERVKMANEEAKKIASSCTGGTGTAAYRTWIDSYDSVLKKEIEKILRERKPKTPSFPKCVAEITLRSWALALSVAAPLALLAADVLLILPTGQPLKVGLAAFVSVITFSAGYCTAPDQYRKIRDRIREMRRESEAWREWRKKYGMGDKK